MVFAKFWAFVSRTRGSGTGRRIGAADVVAYVYLLVGVAIILLPVSWTLVSSLKPREGIEGFDTRLLPYEQVVREIAGVGPKRMYLHESATSPRTEVFKAGPTRRLTEVAPADAPEATFIVPRQELKKQERLRLASENYLDPVLQRAGQGQFHFFTYLYNSIFVTLVATAITLIINSMAAFALSKYQFKGRLTLTILIITTLLIPPTIILVSLFFVVWSLGMFGSLWGVIIPAAATPAGVFLLRQYMLTIPDELIEAARMDAASEWGIYWRIILPLSLPALSVLAILSIIWRWNDFLWPLVVLISDPNKHTLQIGLTAFAGEFDTDLHYVLAMTVLSLIPVTLVFVFLQRYITTGIATTGLK
ncbi:MAG: carbohydrate ABC transporter permease [Rhodobacteraceae bacterium]|nr:carbohydrate ABC transporter permease [Paracoccaceae bacterium]